MKPSDPIRHVVLGYPYRHKKFFFPGGPDVSKQHFQGVIKGEAFKRTFRVSLRVIQDLKYALDHKVYLGERTLSGTEATGLAKYLYDNAIDPMFFANALNAIAHRAKDLEPCVERIKLENLGRISIGRALKGGKIKEDDIGRDFRQFEMKTMPQRFDILKKLGVLKFMPGQSVDTLYPPPPNTPKTPQPPVVLEPRPPIEKVDPRQIEVKKDKSPQLDLFDRPPRKKD